MTDKTAYVWERRPGQYTCEIHGARGLMHRYPGKRTQFDDIYAWAMRQGFTFPEIVQHAPKHGE